MLPRSRSVRLPGYSGQLHPNQQMGTQVLHVRRVLYLSRWHNTLGGGLRWCASGFAMMGSRLEQMNEWQIRVDPSDNVFLRWSNWVNSGGGLLHCCFDLRCISDLVFICYSCCMAGMPLSVALLCLMLVQPRTNPSRNQQSCPTPDRDSTPECPWRSPIIMATKGHSAVPCSSDAHVALSTAAYALKRNNEVNPYEDLLKHLKC